MQNIASSFDKSAEEDAFPKAERAQINALEPARQSIQKFLEETKVPASVFILPRVESYPLLLMTPHQESELSNLKEFFAKKDIKNSIFPGITLSEVLAVIEKQGNKPYGVVLNASFPIVDCLVRSLCSLGAPQAASPALQHA